MSVAFVFRRQAVHLLLLGALLPVTWALGVPMLRDGEWLGIRDTTWFALTIGTAVVHQTYIWLAWRLQLVANVWTHAFGERDFAVYCGPFFALLIARPLLVAATSAADAGTLRMATWLASGLGWLLLVPTLYTAWSVSRYFGFARAAGGDHFRRRYREMPLVERGAFAWTPNAMYTFGFLGLWSIALLYRSHAGLVSALFQHAYIWVHYACTESPDMEVLHGPTSPSMPEQ